MIPHMDNVRQKSNPLVGFFIGWFYRHSDAYPKICCDVGILPIFLPARPFHQTQLLSIELFARLKSAIQRVSPPNWVSAQRAETAMLPGASPALAIPSNVIAASKQTGFNSI
jgi:hypothetical protein